MHTFRPLSNDAQVPKLVNIMEMDRDRPWNQAKSMKSINAVTPTIQKGDQGRGNTQSTATVLLIFETIPDGLSAIIYKSIEGAMASGP